MSNAVQQPVATAPAPPEQDARRVLRSGWIPAALVVTLAVALLLVFEAPPLDVLRYGAWLVFGIALPGTLVWRALRGTPRSFVEDVTMGTTLGFALEIPAYLLAAGAGVSWLVVAAPIGVIAAFLAVPGLRRHWRPTGTPPLSPGVAWALAGIIGGILMWIGVTYFIANGPGDAARTPYIDLPFQLALAGEIKNHVLPRIPFVTGEPLSYHWFVHTHMASASTVTGTDLTVILFRLWLLPLVGIGALGIAVLAIHVTKRQWTGPAAVVVAYFVSTLSPYAWSYGAYSETRLFAERLWASPTQTFGIMLATPAVLLLVDRLRREPGAVGQWVLIGMFMGVITGAKATYLPVLGAGLAFVVLVGLLFRRKLDRAALAGLAITTAAFAFATFILFGGASQGVVIEPLRTSAQLPVTAITQISLHMPEPPVWAQICLAVLMIGAYLVRAAGTVGIIRSRERLLDPVVAFLGGMYLAALGVALLFTHPGSSQFYFVVSAVPYMAVLSVWGLATLIPPERSSWRVRASLVGVAAAGALVVYGVISLDSPAAPTPARLGSRPEVFVELVKPFAVLAVVLALVAAGAWWLWRRRGLHGGIATAAVAVTVLGFGLATPVLEAHGLADRIAAAGHSYQPRPTNARPIAVGGIDAARWLRDHSDPDDLVATNTHCRLVYLDNCDNRHFWISGYTERRILVESWGYTVTSLAEVSTSKQTYYYIGYSNPGLLAENDRAFQEPSAESIAVLRDKHKVKWLFVDERFDTPSPELGDHAKLRYRKDDSAVYELTD